MSTDQDYRRNRLEKWMSQDSETLERLPDDSYAHMEAAVNDVAKKEWRDYQRNLLEVAAKPKIPVQYHNYLRFGAAFLGAVTFSIAPTMLARQTGRGMWAESMGLVGGGVAGYVVHELAVQTIVAHSLKKRYLQNLSSLKQQ